MFTRMLAAFVFALVFALNHAHAANKMQTDLLKRQLVEAIQNEQHRQTLDMISQLRKQGEDVGNEVLFFEARAHYALGDKRGCDAALKKYLDKTGSSGNFYSDALDMLAKRQGEIAEEQRQQAAARAVQQQIAAYRASLKPVGKVLRINTDWGYAVVKLDKTISSGQQLVAELNGKYVTLTVSKINGTEASLTGTDAARLTSGDEVYITNATLPSFM